VREHACLCARAADPLGRTGRHHEDQIECAFCYYLVYCPGGVMFVPGSGWRWAIQASASLDETR
jgi:hypothetical protein